MHRQRLVLLLLLCLFFVHCQCIVLNKCCNDGEGIVKHKALESGFVSYECAEALPNNDTIFLNRTLHPLRSGKADQDFLHGFPERCSNEYFVETNFSQTKPLPAEYCIDKVLIEVSKNGTTEVADGSIIVLTCPVKNFVSSGVVFSMATVNKCCLGNMVYDTDNHMCVNREPLEVSDQKRNMPQKGLFEEFVEGESSLLNIGYGLQSCVTPKVVYEYKIEEYDFEFSEDLLKLNRSDKIYNLKPGTFCLDETLKGSLVARGCRDGCTDGPCVSKCCPEGYIYGFKTENCTDKPSCIPSKDWGLQMKFFNMSNKKLPVPAPTPGMNYKFSQLQYYFLSLQ